MNAIIQKRERSVRKLNSLIQKSRHRLSMVEQKTMLYICSMIKPSDTDLTYQFSITEYIRVCGMADGGRAYRDVKDLLKRLRDNSWELKNEETGEWAFVSWLNKVRGSEKKGTFYVTIDNDLKPYLVDAGARFTDYLLVNVLALSSNYAIHLYEVLKSYAWTGKWIVSVDDFKRMFMLNEIKSYDRWNIVKQKVIDIAITQINEHTDIRAEYMDNGGRGKKTTQIGFRIYLKDKSAYEKIKNNVHEMLDTYNNMDDSKVDKSIWDWLNEGTPKVTYKAPENEGQTTIDDYIDEKHAVMSEYDTYTDIIRSNIEYDILVERNPYSRKELDEIVGIMVETMISKRKTIRVNSEDKPIEAVKSMFMKIDSSHIDYIVDSLQKNTTRVNNIKSYLITTIYNAPLTISNYYSALVKHDLYGEK